MNKRRKIDPDYDPNDDSDYDPDLVSDFPELEQCDKKTRKEFESIQKQIEKTEPSIINILNTPLLLADKIELFQLFEIYGNMTNEVSVEKLDLRKHIDSKLKKAIIKHEQYNQYSEKEHKNFESQIQLLEQYDLNEELKYDILRLNTTQHNKRVIYSEYKRMTHLSASDDELSKIRNWLNWAIALPHDNIREINYNRQQLTNFLRKVAIRMDEELYGMQKVKEQILIFLNSRIINPKMQKCSLGLLGPPGCGKTSIVRLLAEILDFPLQQISLGGVQSPEFLKGHQSVYIGSGPGEIVRCMCRMGAKNGIIFFDEYDKVSDNKEVCASLLHITDASQNSKFQDNYLNTITIDLSHLWFVYSMNKRPTDDALADRIFYVEMNGYDQNDKFSIVKEYLLKRAHQNMGWKPDSVTFEDSAIRYLIEKVSPSSQPGIRSLDHAVSTICNKLNFIYHQQGKMNNFKTSFNLDYKLTFPFVLQQDKIDMFLI